MTSLDFLWIAVWFFAPMLAGYAALAFTRRVFSSLPDGGLMATRVLSIALTTLLCLWMAWLHIAPFSGLLMPVFWLMPIVLTFFALRQKAARDEFFAWLSTHKRALFFSEAIYAVVFFFFLWVRLRHPEINDLEKLMDSALIGTVGNATTVPPPNPWFAGAELNSYYYFGHAMAAMLSRALFTPIPQAYNLALAFFPALFFASLASLGAAIIKSWRGGFAAAFMVALLGHYEPIRQWFSPTPGAEQKLFRLDWWSTSRVIDAPHTINEYPAFTLTVGDAHAHLFAMPLTALLLTLCYALWMNGLSTQVRRLLSVLLGLALGTLIITHTWDVPVFALFIVACGAAALWKQRAAWREYSMAEKAKEIAWIFAPLPLAWIFAQPVLAPFQSRAGGAQREWWQPQPADFFLFWGAFLLLGAFALGVFLHRESSAPSAFVARHVFRAYQVIVAAFAFFALLPATRAFTPVFAVGASLVFSALATAIFLLTRPLQPEIAPEERSLSKRKQAERETRVAQENADYEVALTRRSRQGFLCALACFGLLAMLLPFALYISDEFFQGAMRRINTLFRFGLQAWIFFGFAAACSVFLLFREYSAFARRAYCMALAALFAVPAMCSLCVVWARTSQQATKNADGSISLALDGARFLSSSDRRALDWLRHNAAPNARVLEAPLADAAGQPIGDYDARCARIASLSGLLSPLGWPQHAMFWGPQWNKDIMPRWSAARRLYGGATGALQMQALQLLQPDYIFIGQVERELYGASLPILEKQFPVAFQDGDTKILRVPHKP